MWLVWWGSGPLNSSLLPKVAKPGTGASETGEPSILLEAGWADKDEAGAGDAGADVAVWVIAGFAASGCGSLVGEDPGTWVWVWL